VLEQTRIRIKQYNLHLYELKEQWDVDAPKDLTRYHGLYQNSRNPL